jgi:RNA polymerase sigma-70 factor, ECF subfamily
LDRALYLRALASAAAHLLKGADMLLKGPVNFGRGNDFFWQVFALGPVSAIEKKKAVPAGSRMFDELDLVEAARNGDQEAFGALVKKYMPRALAFARQMTGNPDDAQDLAQDAFIKAYKSLDSFKGGSSFYTWFIRILSNVCLDFLRKKTFIKKIFFFAAPDDEDEGLNAVEQAPDTSRSGSPDMPLEQKELRTALKKALLSLPPRQRAVFLMKHEEDLKLSEIAVALKISEGAVKAHLFRAIDALRKSMKGYYHG